MFDYDRSNFIAFLKNFPEQSQVCVDLIKEYDFKLDTPQIQNIVLAGMGGSAIAGDLLSGYIQEETQVPIIVNRDYSIPHFVNQQTLFIASSYSGNTEETLTSTQEAIKRGAIIIGISSGGKLESICRENNYIYIKIPEGFPPRQALGYLFFSQLLTMEKLKLISSKSAELKETRALLRTLLIRYNLETSKGNNLANHIAQSVYQAIPVIYSAVPYLNAVPIRWRNQFNENSKILAFSNVFPELNHNEIVGWEGVHSLNRFYRVIFLRDPDETPRMKQRIMITKNILRNNKVLFGEVYTEGETRLARLFSLIYTADWASYYLAMLNEKDPITIDSIDLLKKKLSENEVEV